MHSVNQKYFETFQKLSFIEDHRCTHYQKAEKSSFDFFFSVYSHSDIALFLHLARASIQASGDR